MDEQEWLDRKKAELAMIRLKLCGTCDLVSIQKEQVRIQAELDEFVRRLGVKYGGHGQSTA